MIDPEADIGNYTNASIATVACLITHHGGVKVGERHVPANATIPCSTPVLAQNDSVTVGTSVKPSSGPNAGKTLTSPVILRKGEYSVVVIDDIEEWVVQTFAIADETLPEQNETESSQPANNSTARTVRNR